MNAGLRRVLGVWALLLALLALTVAGARIPLGAGNAVLSLAVALAKAALVLACYMRLREPAPLFRAVVAAAVLAVCVLGGLGAVDVLVRGLAP